MKYLGLDLGTKTLGLSMSDKMGLIATSYKIIRHDNDFNSLIPILKTEVENNEIEAFVLGLPKNMNNTLGSRAQDTLEFKKLIEKEIGLDVYLEDERLTTVEATNILLTNDTSRKKRKKVIDSLAATIILQSYLDRKGEKK